jgi:hypothetical protein
VDPLAAKYPFYTPYQYAGNQPVIAIDLDGLEPSVGPGGEGGSKAPVGDDGVPITSLPTVEITAKAPGIWNRLSNRAKVSASEREVSKAWYDHAVAGWNNPGYLPVDKMAGEEIRQRTSFHYDPLGDILEGKSDNKMLASSIALTTKPGFHPGQYVVGAVGIIGAIFIGSMVSEHDQVYRPGMSVVNDPVGSPKSISPARSATKPNGNPALSGDVATDLPISVPADKVGDRPLGEIPIALGDKQMLPSFVSSGKGIPWNDWGDSGLIDEDDFPDYITRNIESFRAAFIAVAEMPNSHFNFLLTTANGKEITITSANSKNSPSNILSWELRTLLFFYKHKVTFWRGSGGKYVVAPGGPNK